MVVLGKTNHHCLEILYGFVIDIRVIGYGTKYLAFVTNLNNRLFITCKKEKHK